MEQVNTILKNKKVKSILYILGYIFIALVIFQAGMSVGFMRARFSFIDGEQYFRQMSGKMNSPFMGMNRNDFENSHGAIGKIVSISLPSFIVADKDGVEKTIIVSTSTDIREFKNSIKSSDLMINDFVTIIGNPNDKAEIEAKLIRIMPDPTNVFPGPNENEARGQKQI